MYKLIGVKKATGQRPVVVELGRQQPEPEPQPGPTKIIFYCFKMILN
jgi:hypothetical protein